MTLDESTFWNSNLHLFYKILFLIFKSFLRKVSAMTNLKQYYPMLRTKEQVRESISKNYDVNRIFLNMSPENRDRFVDICSGNRGVRILYDAYFKEIFNPDIDPQRLIRLLSLLLNKKITEIRSLRNTSSLIEDNRTLMILDIVVKLDDGSLVNVEVQKYGYDFPGQRAACYSSDLLLRQYGRIRNKSKKDFNYKNLSPVYSIIFMDTSPGEFRRYPSDYIFRSAQKTDPDINLEFLQYFIFIPLDNFLNSVKNKKQEGLPDLDAWLLFLSFDNPEDILYLTERNPEFIPMYEQLFTICSNEGRMLEMYSAELRMMDNNTVKLMIDKMNEKLDEKDRELEAKDREIEANKHELEAKDREIEKLKAMLAEK